MVCFSPGQKKWMPLHKVFDNYVVWKLNVHTLMYENHMEVVPLGTRPCFKVNITSYEWYQGVVADGKANLQSWPGLRKSIWNQYSPFPKLNSKPQPKIKSYVAQTATDISRESFSLLYFCSSMSRHSCQFLFYLFISQMAFTNDRYTVKLATLIVWNKFFV